MQLKFEWNLCLVVLFNDVTFKCIKFEISYIVCVIMTCIHIKL